MQRNYFLHHKVQRLLFPYPADPSPFSPVIGAEFPPPPLSGYGICSRMNFGLFFTAFGCCFIFVLSKNYS